MAVGPKTVTADPISKLTAQCGCGPIKFTQTGEALYERHLLFDNIVDASAVTVRERFEAIARSVRDVLSLLDPIATQLIKEKNLDWIGLLEQEPDGWQEERPDHWLRSNSRHRCAKLSVLKLAAIARLRRGATSCGRAAIQLARQTGGLVRKNLFARLISLAVIAVA